MHRVKIQRSWRVAAIVIIAGLVLATVVLLGRGRTVPAGTLAGKVIDENKSAVRNAQVYVYSPSDANRVEVRTDWLGNFRLEGVPRDREFGVMVSYFEYGHFTFPGLRSGEWWRLQILPHGYELHGKPTPPLAIEKWYNANPLSLADLRGKVVLLHIGLHIDNYDHYNRTVLSVYRQYREKGLVVVGIHANPSGSWPRQTTDDEVLAYLNTKEISFPVGLDKQDLGSVGATYRAYGAHANPAKYLVDKKGVLRCSPLDENLEQWVKRLLVE